MSAPTPKQRRYLGAIYRLTQAADGVPPTTRELLDELGLRSLNGAHEMLARLERDGYLEPRPAHAARCVRLTPRGVVALGPAVTEAEAVAAVTTALDILEAARTGADLELARRSAKRAQALTSALSQMEMGR